MLNFMLSRTTIEALLFVQSSKKENKSLKAQAFSMDDACQPPKRAVQYGS